MEASLTVVGTEAVDPLRRSGKRDPMAGLARPDAERDRKRVFCRSSAAK
jgi:hypothetical protein